MSRRERPIVASVEDADESGNPIEESARYASSVAPSSPAKEQPNTGRARNRARKGSSSPITTSVLTDSDTTVHPRRDSLKKPSKDRDRSASSKKALMPASRPPVKHAKTTSSIPHTRRDMEATYYGVDPTITPAASRPPHQQRPSSYYGGAPLRPPPANTRFYNNQPPGPPLPSSFAPPPPHWMGPPGPRPGPGGIQAPFGPPSAAPVVMHHPPPPPPSEYQYTRPLESRFGSGRPQSAMGFRQPRAIEYDEYEEPVERSLARRPSTTSRKVSKNDEDRKAMPPPRRPATARPTALAFRPPPSTPARRKPDLDEYDPDPDDHLFEVSPFAPASYEHNSPFRPRGPSFGPENGYDHDYHTEVAAGKNLRRNSYYGGNSGSSGSAYEDKMRQATRYQDDLGGPQMPLTAETLRKAGRSASSRSTRSSGSHDESEYRQSATTRTTRSTAPNDEDVTIRVKGASVFKIGNAEMKCQDGAEINIISRNGNAEMRTAASDRSSYIDPADDRRTRVDIPHSRARAVSRAKSRPRSYSARNFSKYEVAPPYDPALDYDAYTSYGAPPLPPAYPEFPSSLSSRHGDGFWLSDLADHAPQR
ncbi:hypothetical protein N658DRAFT_419304 [Parathielavia hyrcaniae]|uniref:Uncharacterized protein n=1 Tax=Parathielavia hyrcaniae TaxID=113614 RepID=A0AAN6T4S1_9PEZI|nr:hypothetical protein N658DRAFT_419304 [Parathielavia hyrcaniae]